MEEDKSAFIISIGKLTGKKPLGEYKRTWEKKEIGVNTRNQIIS
jgi:hypothetical protein